MPAEIKSALALREKYGIQEPVSASIIYVDSISVHHTKQEYSTIGWRGKNGDWSISGMGEDGPGGLLVISPMVIPERVGKLSVIDNTALDHLLDSRKLYEESPRSRLDKTSHVATSHTMEIITPNGHVVVRWVGRLKGRLGQVADIVLGKG
jgi:hypothetical protein